MTTAIPAKDFLIKVDPLSDGNFRTVGGIKTRTLSFNGNLVDITNQSSEGNWREAIAGVDIKSMTLSGEGILEATFTFATLNDIYRNQIGKGYEWQAIAPGLGIYQGRFVLVSKEYTGEQNNVVMFSMTLESAGVIDFQALAA